MSRGNQWIFRIGVLACVLFFCGCLKTVSGQYYNIKADRLYENDQKDEAFDYYYQSAQNGIAESQYLVAQMMLYGDGIRRNDSEGMHWLEEAARQDHPLACRDLGIYLINGEFGRTRDSQQGAGFLERAAAQKETLAMVTLGYLYTTGYGVPRDPEKAAAWYRQAAQYGEPLPDGLQDASLLAQAKPRPFNAAEERRARVKRAQACLKVLGYYKSGVDGIAGPGTAAAVKKFQKDINVDASGSIDAVLMRQLSARIFIAPLKRQL
jgi:TPR repeat protein